MSRWKKMLGIFMSGVVLITGGILPQDKVATVTAAEGTDHKIRNPRTENGVTTWDKIKFGSYYQDAEVQSEPIKWRVLSVDGDDAFLLADKNLDCKKYNEEYTGITWETSTLRKWLNEDFYNEAFDAEEKKAVKETLVTNEDHPIYNTEGGNDTKDKVYLLSTSEASNKAYGFDTEYREKSKTREAKNTDYAKEQGAWTNTNTVSSYTGNGCWWLRSPGEYSYYAAYVGSGGYGSLDGEDVGISRYAVRPALHINLSSFNVEDAGEVDSEGNVTVSGDGIKSPRIEDGVTTWDCVYFGNYRQKSGSFDMQDIEWRVLSVDGDDAFLLADRSLDVKPYNEEYEDVTWETCTLRKWLNEDFYNLAFDVEEKKAVKETKVINEENPYYGTVEGSDTTDKVYLLSISEACNEAYGFDTTFNRDSKTREAKNTDYVKVQGDWSSTDFDYAGIGNWWLRSPGEYSKKAMCVSNDGCGNYSGYEVGNCEDAVRPVLHINLSSASWSKAGEVTAVRNDELEVTEKPWTAEPTKEPVATATPTKRPGETDYGISNPRVTNGVTTWDKVKFGSYYQDVNIQPAEPIKWRVLSVDGDDAFLLADRNLDTKPYNEKSGCTWETSTLRKWLNRDFYNEAFDAEEKKAVIETTVINEDNPSYDTKGGHDTKDKVFLLSISEVSNEAYGFDVKFNKDSNTRKAKNTDYAKLHGAWTSTVSGTAGNGCWWLRSSGINRWYAACVDNCGGGNYSGHDVQDSDYVVVRPALHINLSFFNVEDAGEVDSEGNITASGDGIKSPRIKDGVTTWDCVYFGNYRQSCAFNKQDIEWRVLSVDGDDAFLLADRNLDAKPYNEAWGATWETCTLRKWLNEDFYNEAFDAEEKKAVKETKVINEDNPYYGTDGGSDTMDKVYMLSISEACNKAYGFDTVLGRVSKTREAKNTDYTKAQGAYTSTASDTDGNGGWWLRSPGKHIHGHDAAYVRYDGYGSRYGYGVVHSEDAVVRPALHINLSSASWSKADEVTAVCNNEPGVTEKPMVTAEPTKEPAASAIPTKRPEETNYTISSPRIKNGVTTWDKIKFGSYYQDIRPAEPIKWRVLSVDGDDAFLLADRNLDAKPYDEEDKSNTWETSTLRKWLNEDFYNEAFDEKEKKAVKDTTVINEDASYYSTDESSDTMDKVYLLSISEASNEAYGFDTEYNENSKTREAKNTGYAKEQGAYTSTASDTDGNGCWWLRSPSHSFSNAAYVGDGGCGYYYGYVADSDYGVRPALHINLSSFNVEDAGEVDSEGNVTESGDGIKSPRIKDGVTTWDCVYFGNYRQSGAFNKKDIEWRVLSVDGDDAFLLADRNLDCKQYNWAREATWETCTLRQWLNGYFYNEAFDEEEKKAIKETIVINEDHQYYGTEGGSDTTDKVYLLSISEACNKVYGFDTILGRDSNTREAKNTDYAEAQGACSNTASGTAGNGCWWLRSPGSNSAFAAYVYYNGYGDDQGLHIAYGEDVAVRPALHINLSSALWSKVGEVTAVRNDKPEPSCSPSPTPSVQPDATATPTKKPDETEKPDATAMPTKKPDVTEKPDATATPTKKPDETEKPDASATPTKQPGETENPNTSATPTKKPNETEKPDSTAIPAMQPEGILEPSVSAKSSVPSEAFVFQKIKISGVKCVKNAKKITGKVSVTKATVRIKVGKKAYKKASVKGKKFTLKLNYRLKKKTKITVKVTKKGYKEIRKVYRVK